MKLEAILKKLSPETLDKVNSASAEELSALIVASEQAIRDTKEELDANEKYQELKESCKAMSAGYREVKSYQSAQIQYALMRLRDLGK